MLGSTPLSAILGAAPPADADTDRIKAFAKAAVNAGLALMLIAPGSKLPVDMRSDVQRRKEDKAAQEAAKAAGRMDWDKARSKKGVHLATTDPIAIGRYIDRYRKLFPEQPVNFAIEVGRSGIVVIDCDTKAQLSAFATDCGFVPELIADFPPPTVTSPGSRNEDGTWSHDQGCGHFWFTANDLPTGGSGSYTAPGEYAVLWRDRYVLIPPSVRPEGPYELTGREYPLPDWLREAINKHAAGRAERAAKRTEAEQEQADDLKSGIDSWAETVSWEDILAPAGWVKTARPDQCGCEVWTAPGVHASPKSATTHDTGCTLGFYTEVNAPIHIWTDNPGEEFEEWIRSSGSKTLSKIQAVAALQYSGNMGKALEKTGSIPPPVTEADFGVNTRDNFGTDADGAEVSAANLDADLDDLIDPITPMPAAGPPVDLPKPDDQDQYEQSFCDPEPETAAGSPPPPQDPPADPPEDNPFDGEDAEEHEDELSHPGGNGVPKMGPFDKWRDLPAPEYAIDGLLEHGSLSALIGPPGMGKSTMAIDMACSLVTGIRWQGRKVIRQRVLYLPGEGLSGAVQRIKAWEKAHDLNVGQDLILGDNIIQLGAKPEAWNEMTGFLLQARVGLIIFDTFARMAMGIEENSATDVGKAIIRFDRIRRLTQAGVMVVHHTGKANPASGRGSSALNGALDTELLVSEPRWDASILPPEDAGLDLTTSKQKNAPRLRDPMPLRLTSMHGAVVLTTPTGEIGDPFDSVAAAPLIMPEPLIECSIRLAEYAERFPSQGVTRGDLREGVEPDPYIAAKPNPGPLWKRRINEATDLAMRFGLLDTLSGLPTGSRYIRSVTTAQDARTRAAAEAMEDAD